MSLYQREGSPYWYYTFAVAGRRFRGSTGKTSKREAKAVEAQRRYDAQNEQPVNDDWTLQTCFAHYHAERAKQSRSYKTILGNLAAVLRSIDKDTPLSELTNSMLMDYRANRRGEGVQAHTVNRDLDHLKAALNHASQIHGKRVPVLAWKAIKVAEPPARIRFLSADEAALLLKHCDPDLRTIVSFALATGLRKANILKLEWSQVDLSSARVTVLLKGNKLHSIKLIPATRAALAAMPDKTGQVFNTTNFRRRWKRAVENAGLENFRFHDLRHTFASWARMNGADIADICEALGHSNISVTMRYAHIEPKDHVTAFDRLSGKVWSQFEAQSASEAQNG